MELFQFAGEMGSTAPTPVSGLSFGAPSRRTRTRLPERIEVNRRRTNASDEGVPGCARLRGRSHFVAAKARGGRAPLDFAERFDATEFFTHFCGRDRCGCGLTSSM
jgi:hypothetical protein